MNLRQVLTTVFAVCMSISIFGGFVVFVMHIAGILTGLMIDAGQGANIMVFANEKVTKFLIQASSIGVIIGLVLIYITDKHTLTYTKSED